MVYLWFEAQTQTSTESAATAMKRSFPVNNGISKEGQLVSKSTRRSDSTKVTKAWTKHAYWQSNFKSM